LGKRVAISVAIAWCAVSTWTTTRSEDRTEAIALRRQMSTPEDAEKADSEQTRGLDMPSMG
jgi:hypothetical protein